MSFHLSMEGKCRDGFARSCPLLMCLENHQPPVLSATLQMLFIFLFLGSAVFFIVALYEIVCFLGKIISVLAKSKTIDRKEPWEQ